MANGNGAAIHIHDLWIEFKFPNAGNRLGGESFIQFNEVKIFNGEACTKQGLFSGGHGAYSHN